MAAFLDTCRFNPTLGGTTDFVFSSVVQGYTTPALSGVANGRIYKWRAESADLSQWELFEGAYNTSPGVALRTAVLYNSSGTGTGPGQSGAGTKINFSTVPQVACVALKEDLISIEEANAFTAAQRAQARSNISAVLKGALFGLTLSAAGGTATFGIAAGEAADSTGVDLMVLASAYTKTTSAWTVGSTNGAMDTGSVANNTWYYVHLIKRPDTGVVDVLFSLSATAPTLPTNYTIFRRLGAMKTNGSAQWIKFVQVGDYFMWAVPAIDVSNTNPTSATNYTMSVPTGITVCADESFLWSSPTIGSVCYLDSLLSDQVSNTVAGGYLLALPTASQVAIQRMAIWTANGQFRVLSNAAGGFYATCWGWTDTRGRLG